MDKRRLLLFLCETLGKALVLLFFVLMAIFFGG